MCKYCEKMDMVKALDFAIRDCELQNKNNGYSSGYLIDGKEYLNYLSENSWEKFKGEMSDEHIGQYIEGGGNELDKRNSRWGMLPPKMASFGSSSRMIYNLSKDTPGFVFEKQMPTHVGHDANLDGYLLNDNFAIFVEAKCREIYSSHANLDISNAYKDVYDYIHDKKKSFRYVSNESKEQDHFKCTFKFGDEIIHHFDVKQLICHFLGITAALIDNKIESNSIKFIYLIFNPNYNTDFSNDAIKNYENKLKVQYDETIIEIEKFGDMKWLFECIMNYQISRLRPSKVCYTFDFKLMDQEEYKNYLSEISSHTLLQS